MMRTFRAPVWVAGAAAVLLTTAPTKAFDLSMHEVPVEEIVSAGPGKDGIPAILEPKFVPPEEATFLDGEERVIGVGADGLARAYPVKILRWHEVVNDDVGDRPLAVTYCSLTASGVVFDRRVDGATVTFGVSGRLYQNNLLLYDEATESLWSQIGGRAIAGRRTGETLEPVPSVHTTWQEWLRRHPDSLVLSPETGYSGYYDRDPYVEYRSSDDVLFPLSRVDDRIPRKTRVVGIKLKGDVVALPVHELERASFPLDVRIGDQNVTVHHDPESHATRAFIDGEAVPVFTGYWFAWYAFHPQTRVYAREPDGPSGLSRVTIVEKEGHWSDMVGVGMTGLDQTSRGGPEPTGSFYVISGKLRNETEEPIGYVKLLYELLDDEGNVVYREYGYNRKAEALREEAFESGSRSLEDMDISPVAPGETETFRMLLFKDDLPDFRDYWVGVQEAPHR